MNKCQGIFETILWLPCTPFVAIRKGLDFVQYFYMLTKYELGLSNKYGLSSLTGIRQYLVLLSIYQTCKYRDIPFLKFLLSGRKDICNYAEGQGQK
jgi:hypothetical protein